MTLEQSAVQMIANAQVGQRLPGVSATIAGPEGVLWEGASGFADIASGQPASPATRYRVGSVTKTFTAVAILRLRDAGRLRLEDPVSVYVAEAASSQVTLRDLLAHASGLQREPPGRVWEQPRMPAIDEFLATVGDAEAVLEPCEYWHYSNLGFVLLGEVVTRVAGRPYGEVVEEEILRPLGLTQTGWAANGPTATGYLVDPDTDSVAVEPVLDLEGLAAAGQLWSTTGDLCRWGLFLLDPNPQVLRASTAAEMRRLRIMSDPNRWTVGWGLGLALWRRGERFYFGHLGGMPGHRAALVVSPSGRRAGAVLVNCTAGGDIEAMGLGLCELAVSSAPALPAPWVPSGPLPTEVAGIVGPWWSEGVEHRFRYRAGALEARVPDQRDAEPSVFTQLGPDRWRTISGPERGELLEVTRDASGAVRHLHWATYRFDREPRPFGAGAEGD